MDIQIITDPELVITGYLLQKGLREVKICLVTAHEPQKGSLACPETVFVIVGVFSCSCKRILEHYVGPHQLVYTGLHLIITVFQPAGSVGFDNRYVILGKEKPRMDKTD